MNQQQEFNNISSLIEILNSDVQHIVDKLNLSDEELDFNIRSYIRAYSSWIEGTVWMLKELIKGDEHQWHQTMPLASQLYLFEHDWKIKNTGEPVLTSRKLKTKENIKGLFHITTHLDQSFGIDYNSKGWNQIIHFYELRDNLMHPKSLDSLSITKNQVLKCDEGRAWLFSKFAEVAKIIIQKTYA